MAIRSWIETLVLLLALIVVPACRKDPLIKAANQPPRADARVLRDGMAVDETTSDTALAFDFSGTPIAITLDGSKSSDIDGKVVGYRWLSGNPPADGGMPAPGVHRWVPPGEAGNWPADVMQPQVMLGEGIWSFELWVTDDKGLLSTPDTVKITIGKVLDPAVAMCADKVVTTEPQACRECVCKDAKCRPLVAADMCNQSCWDLINCVANNCPDFVAMAMKMPPDYSCLTMNCMAYLAGSTGATPAAPCFRACPQECGGVMPGGMGTGGAGGGTGGSGAMGSGGSASGDDGGT